MTRQDWYEAYLLLSFVCPCEARRSVHEGYAAASVDQLDVADHWLRLGACVNAILVSVTIQ